MAKILFSLLTLITISITACSSTTPPIQAQNSPTQSIPTVTPNLPTHTPTPTASNTPTITSTPTSTPSPTPTFTPEPTSTPTMPPASSAPEGSNVVTVEVYEGKILGLNQHGWAEMEFKNGEWVEFVREISFAANVDDIIEQIPEYMLAEVDPNSITRLKVDGNRFISPESGNPIEWYDGWELPHDKDGNLAFGYLTTDKYRWNWGEKIEEKPYRAYLSGFPLGIISYDKYGTYMVFEIPQKTERQILLYWLPNQGTTQTGIYRIGESGVVNTMYREPALYSEVIEAFRTRNIVGRQMVLDIQIEYPDDWQWGNQVDNERLNRLVEAIKAGTSINVDVDMMVLDYWLPEDILDGY